jgi:DNA (cytosine-5)-methyltransferase 1
MKLRVFEAFAGYGSQSIALDLLSQSFPDFQFETVGISEIDKYAIRAYHTLHGEAIPNHGDITKIDWSQTADFDLLTYSFPCQDISSVGKQRGFSEGSGTRSSCLWACANAIEKKHPRFLLMENVKALTQKKFSADFRRWRKWLIKQGYTNYYAVLNAKDYGVPQNRERVFMVSFRREHTPFTFPKPFELVRRLKHILEDVVDEKYWLKQEQIQALIKHNERKQSEGCGFKTNFQTGEGISGTIKTREGLCSCDTLIKVPIYGNSRLNAMIADGKVDPEETLWIDCYNQRVDPDIAGTILARVNATGHYLVSDPRGCAMRGRPDASGRNLNCNEGGQREVKILQRGHGYAKGGFFDIAPAMTTSKWQDNNFAVIEYWIRKLTPRECFRLMDVPEHHINRLLNAGISNSQLYKLAGNSIVVACLYHIFRKMFCETAREYGAPTAHSQEIPDVQQLSLF